LFGLSPFRNNQALSRQLRLFGTEKGCLGSAGSYCYSKSDRETAFPVAGPGNSGLGFEDLHPVRRLAQISEATIACWYPFHLKMEQKKQRDNTVASSAGA
jgi:hypothetical protein